MSWNHRVVRKSGEDGLGAVYEIHEVHYDETGAISGWTERPVTPCGESRAELREEIRAFLGAFRRPVLEWEDERLVEIENESRINPGHYFELLDRTAVALDYLHDFVGSHPVLVRDHALRARYEQVEGLLAELYQLVGARDETWS